MSYRSSRIEKGIPIKSQDLFKKFVKKKWIHLKGKKISGKMEYCLDEVIAPHTKKPIHSFYLEFVMDKEINPEKYEVVVKTDLQINPFSLPEIHPGENIIILHCDKPKNPLIKFEYIIDYKED